VAAKAAKVVAAEAAKKAKAAETAKSHAADVWAEASSRSRLLAWVEEQQELIVDQHKKLRVFQLAFQTDPRAIIPNEIRQMLRRHINSSDKVGELIDKLMEERADAPDEVREELHEDVMSVARFEAREELREKLTEMFRAGESAEEQTARRRQCERADRLARVKNLACELSNLDHPDFLLPLAQMCDTVTVAANSDLLQPLREMRDAVIAAATNARRNTAIDQGINSETLAHRQLHGLETSAGIWRELVGDVEALFAKCELRERATTPTV